MSSPPAARSRRCSSRSVRAWRRGWVPFSVVNLIQAMVGGVSPMSGPAPNNPSGAGRNRAAGREAAREIRTLRPKRWERQSQNGGAEKERVVHDPQDHVL
jgi:hypothetical protein